MPSSQNAGKISSPEQLTNYIHVTQPGAWIVLSGVLVFLAGFFIWIFTGELEVSSPAYAYAQGEEVYAYVFPELAAKLKAGMQVRLAESGISGQVKAVENKLSSYEEILSQIGQTNASAMNINASDKLIRVDLNMNNAPQDVSRVIFVTDTVKPLTLFLK